MSMRLEGPKRQAGPLIEIKCPYLIGPTVGTVKEQ